MWRGLKLLLLRCGLQRNDLLRSVGNARSPSLSIEDAGVGRHSWLIWSRLIRGRRLSNLILLLLDAVLNSIQVAELAGRSLHRHGLSRCCLVRNRLHCSGVV